MLENMNIINIGHNPTSAIVSVSFDDGFIGCKFIYCINNGIVCFDFCVA